MNNLLDKFFKEGDIENRYGIKTGRISHINDNSAVVYNNSGESVGYIEIYGDDVSIYDEKGGLIEKGNYYENSNTIETLSFLDASVSRKYQLDNGRSFGISSNQTMYDKSFSSYDADSLSEPCNYGHSGGNFFGSCSYCDDDDDYDYDYGLL